MARCRECYMILTLNDGFALITIDVNPEISF